MLNQTPSLARILTMVGFAVSCFGILLYLWVSFGGALPLERRFVAAIDRSPAQPAFFTVAYMVRAVSPGRYVHPAAHVEDMYRPERFGRTGYGTVEVVQAKP